MAEEFNTSQLQTFEGIKNIVSRFESLIIEEEELKQLEFQLKNLLEILKTQEQAIYNELQISQSGLCGLYEKLEEWKAIAPPSKIREKNFIDELYEILPSPKIDVAQELNLESPDLSRELVNQIKEEVNTYLQSQGNKNTVKGRNIMEVGKNIMKVTSGDPEFIERIITNSKIFEKTGKKGRGKRILGTLFVTLPNTEAFKNQDLVNEIKRIFASRFQGQALNLFNVEIDNHIARNGLGQTSQSGSYGLYKNINVIKGFLGEIYWNGFFHFLGLGITPTGTDLNLFGQEISIDAVFTNLLGAGVQMKNWALSQFDTNLQQWIQTRTFNTTMKLGTFLEQRADAISYTARLIIALMFVASEYNIPKDEQNPFITDDSDNTVVSEEKSKYKEFYENNLQDFENKNAAKLNTLFQNALASIIGISHGEQVVKNPEQKVTFWLFQGRYIVPSSWIIQGIIDSIDENKRIVTLNNIQYTRVGGDKAPHYPQEINSSPFKAANSYFNISYTVQWNFKIMIDKINNLLRGLIQK